MPSPTPNEPVRSVADLMVELRERAALELLDCQWDGIAYAAHRRHQPHRNAACPICQGDVPRIADIAMRAAAPVVEELNKVRADLVTAQREREQFRTSLPAEVQDYWFWRHRAEKAEAELGKSRQAAKDLGEIVVHLTDLIRDAWLHGVANPFEALHMLGNHLAQALTDDENPDEHNAAFRALEAKRHEWTSLAEQVKRVRELHVEHAHSGTCKFCWLAWPCDTIRALDGTEADRD